MRGCGGRTAPAQRASTVSLQLAGDLADLVRLDDVALFHVVEVLDPDAALEPFAHLTDVILEAAERPDPAVVRDDTVPDDAGARVPGDRPLDDVRPGHEPDPRNAEERADLRTPELGLALFGLQHAAHGIADVVDRVVDHAVQANVHALLLGQVPGLHVRADVEPDDDRAGGQLEVDVALGDRSGRAVDHVHADLVLRELGKRVDERPDRTLHVGLHDQVQLGDLVALGLRHELLQRRGPLGDHLGRADLRLALLHHVPRLALVRNLANVVPGVRRGGPAEDLHGLAGAGLLHLLTVLVQHRADLRPRRAGHERVADVERATLNEHAGDRPAALVQVRLEHDAARPSDRVALQLLEVGHEQDRLEQVVQVGPRLRRDVDELVLAAPLRGHDPHLDHLLPHARRIGLGFVDLVHRDDDRHARRLRM